MNQETALLVILFGVDITAGELGRQFNNMHLLAVGAGVIAYAGFACVYRIFKR